MSLDCVAEVGMSIETGTAAAMTLPASAGAVAGDEWAGEGTLVLIVESSALTLCVEALDAQPVRRSKATAADAKHLRRPLVELVIRSNQF